MTEQEIKAFRHCHVAKYSDDGKLLDECKQCGLELLHETHIRAEK